jgi:hypothetical protein
VEGLGGTLLIKSTLGQGTTASVELPMVVDLQHIAQYAPAEYASAEHASDESRGSTGMQTNV